MREDSKIPCKKTSCMANMKNGYCMWKMDQHLIESVNANIDDKKLCPKIVKLVSKSAQ